MSIVINDMKPHTGMNRMLIIHAVLITGGLPERWKA
jgi:hypothetical protein